MRFDKHTITIVRTTGYTRDTAGVSTPVTTSRRLRGIASLVGAQEQFIGQQEGRTFSVAVQLPPGTVVSTATDSLVVDGTGVLGLDGPYVIVEARPDIMAVRVLCKRYEVTQTVVPT